MLSPERSCIAQGVRLAARPAQYALRMKLIAGAWGGAMLAGMLCIAYNTSANVSALEGGREHMTFGYVATIIGAGAAAGLLAGAVVLAITASTRDEP